MDRTALTVLALALGLAVSVPMQRFQLEQQQQAFMLPLTPAEAVAHAANHTFLHVVGQHRGGTTLLWNGIGLHPEVASLGGGRRSAAAAARFPWIGAMRHEGVFMQDVYPVLLLDHGWGLSLKSVSYILFSVSARGLPPRLRDSTPTHHSAAACSVVPDRLCCTRPSSASDLPRSDGAG